MERQFFVVFWTLTLSYHNKTGRVLQRGIVAGKLDGPASPVYFQIHSNMIHDDNTQQRRLVPRVTSGPKRECSTPSVCTTRFTYNIRFRITATVVEHIPIRVESFRGNYYLIFFRFYKITRFGRLLTNTLVRDEPVRTTRRVFDLCVERAFIKLNVYTQQPRVLSFR